MHTSNRAEPAEQLGSPTGEQTGLLQTTAAYSLAQTTLQRLQGTPAASHSDAADKKHQTRQVSG